METKFSILSHACLLIERGATKIIIDPWLVGACYWGSWWNFPEPEINPALLEKVDYVIISHVHWDHWHGLTLKKFFKGCQYIVPDEYCNRSYNDLKKCKLGTIQKAKHGVSLQLPDKIVITCYNFGLFLNDAAIVIETPECKLFDVNDCKITGLPLTHILKKHGHFDFALRSHSSANYRACINTNDVNEVDDSLHYSRSFKLFIDRVKPTYAVPFASNHCHLHKDTYAFNSLVTNPLILKQQLGNNPFLDTELKIMLPGSSWSSNSGFTIKSLDIYNNIDSHLINYKMKKNETITGLYAKEAVKKIDQRVIDRHCTHLHFIPKFTRKTLSHYSIAYCIRTIDNEFSYYYIDLLTPSLLLCDRNKYSSANVRIEWPVSVFRDAVYKKMYHHAFISKRVRFDTTGSGFLKPLIKLITSLELIELEFYPVRFSYLFRMFKAYCVRYREVGVFFLAFYYSKIKKMPLYLVEEKISSGK